MRALTESGRDNLGACIAMIILTTLATIARFAVKTSRHQAPTGADWLCLLSMPLFYTYCGLIIHFIVDTSLYGSFDIEPTRGLVELRNLLKTTYASEILFGLIITIAKLSILWLYYTIFSGANSTLNKLVIKGAAVACLVWFVVATFVVVFQCNPIHAYWDNYVMKPWCFSSPRLLLGYEMTNLFFDVAILCIPVPIVWKLRLSSFKKMGVLVIFLLGAFVCVASIVRLSMIWHPPDVDKGVDFSPTMMWSTIQLGLAIICACLPTLGPLLPTISTPFEYIGSWTASLWSRSSPNSSGRGYKISNQYEMPDAGNKPPSSSQHERDNMGFHGSSRSWAHGSSGDGHVDHKVERMPPKGIMVDRDVRVA
ncbi:hypothetical protein HRG_004277 [Hirsutella rhossiliensis]|uniref:Rhodopsin domain-containing protein n=1 Tax=Hirsutella rhossiliensis TaxID=111463 RepID=A0A9P8MZ19_9HYPO|nr:uncharacterized protein HRG_04277 [Hirsutella rhossiliensis]KAH0963849.1 hypothetical protein HRG_04277 [Hirsutella rhossiliensis]